MTTFVRLLLLTLLAATLCDDTFAQETTPTVEKRDLPVAILNLDVLLNVNTNPTLAARIAPIRELAQKAKDSVELLQAELQGVQLELQKTKPGTKEFESLQRQGIRLQTEIQQTVAKEQQALAQKENAVLIGYYKEMEEEVRKYCKAKGIKLVLRQQQSSSDSQNIGEQIKFLNRQVIFEDGLDITEDIRKALDARNAPKP